MVGGGAIAQGTILLDDAARHETREQAAREGRLVLSVRELDDERQQPAMRIMQTAGATKVEPMVNDDGSVPLAGWTG